MDKKELFDLYEKLYFHEIDSRERLGARLQIPLTLIVSFIGVIAFMLQNYEYHEASYAGTLFLILLLASVLALINSVYCFIRSWYNNTYYFIPSAELLEDYSSKLKEYYKRSEAAEHLREYILKQYIDCSSQNTICNDRRSIYLHKTNTALIITAVIAFCAFLVFYFGELDKSHIRKPTEVTIINPVEIKGVNMTDNKPPTPPRASAPSKPPATPPQPPTPPQPRMIREGVEVINPQNKVPPEGKKP